MNLAKTSPEGRIVFDSGYSSDAEYHELHDHWVMSEMIRAALINMRNEMQKRYRMEPYVVLGANE